ncbi:aldehyde dehydrogenase [Saccharopolyspora erythraea]|uniref:aldehyde dehydrogenase n=1 Tax=Saccharopolyspora erythraea TaxID=1836 RepID=UPI001BAB401A|nr:aldehyde dehydrogenase [Saccharopolyspora erythraea]QUH03563.1 aldehyde dehydrogenase [Saccharopolyspora erythraea]
MSIPDRLRFYVDGAWRQPSGGERYSLLEAATGEALGTAAMAAPEDVDAAVRAARRAFDAGEWGIAPAEERSKLLHRFADALSARAETTSTLVSRENGMPIGLSRVANGAGPVAQLRRYADLVAGMELEQPRPSPLGSTIVRREPVGVVAAITPWNYPQSLAMAKIAPALAVGCSVVLKPSPETALDAYVLADAAEEAGLPPGVFNVVAGGRDTGAAVVAHPGVDKVAFTGSTAAGRAVGAECGRQVKRFMLELGGKSAAIVLDDCDLDVLRAGLETASFRNNGQTCSAQTRVLAPRSRYDEVVEAVVGVAEELVLGNPLDPSVTCGPMVTEEHRERVLGYVRTARESGAVLACGGGRPAGLDRGWFVEPTVFVDVDNSEPLAREEVFGPVLAVIPYDGEDEAVEIANDSEYGLAGSVWTSDDERGLDICRRVRTGTIGINYYSLDFGAPFGGVKQSGVGRELGPEAVDGYLEYKSIYAGADRLSGSS